MKNRFDTITNTAVLIVTLLVAFQFFGGLLIRKPVLKAGNKLPEIAGFSWSQGQTLVLALRKGCPYCEHSMEFYSRLAAMQEASHATSRIIAIFPDDKQAATEVMRTHNVSIPVFSSIKVYDFSISGTPTLILVDQKGRVLKSWVGELDGAGEEEVIRALQVVASKNIR